MLYVTSGRENASVNPSLLETHMYAAFPVSINKSKRYDITGSYMSYKPFIKSTEFNIETHGLCIGREWTSRCYGYHMLVKMSLFKNNKIEYL